MAYLSGTVLVSGSVSVSQVAGLICMISDRFFLDFLCIFHPFGSIPVWASMIKREQSGHNPPIRSWCTFKFSSMMIYQPELNYINHFGHTSLTKLSIGIICRLGRWWYHFAQPYGIGVVTLSRISYSNHTAKPRSAKHFRFVDGSLRMPTLISSSAAMTSLTSQWHSFSPDVKRRKGKDWETNQEDALNNKTAWIALPCK